MFFSCSYSLSASCTKLPAALSATRSASTDDAGGASEPGTSLGSPRLLHPHSASLSGSSTCVKGLKKMLQKRYLQQQLGVSSSQPQQPPHAYAYAYANLCADGAASCSGKCTMHLTRLLSLQVTRLVSARLLTSRTLNNCLFTY